VFNNGLLAIILLLALLKELGGAQQKTVAEFGKSQR
jgi:hypothetical protein